MACEVSRGESRGSRESRKRKHDHSAIFFVELFCSSTETTRKERIIFEASKQPELVLDIQKKVEADFSIPTCVQYLTYEAYPMTEEMDLKEARIRDGDTFRVEYSSEGDCGEILDVARWFNRVRVLLEKEQGSIIDDNMSPVLDYLLTTGISEEMVENLAFKYLYPWLDARKYANKLYFVSCGGLKEMMGVYAQILIYPWSRCVTMVQCLEYSILRVLWNLSETFELRRQMLAHNHCLELCMQSLLREKMPLTNGMKMTVGNFSWTILVETIGAALGFLCNLSELPECHMTIATFPGCLDQLACISMCPHMRPISVQLVATLFLCLAYTPKTHPHLTEPHLLRKLVDAVHNKRPSEDYSENQDEVGDEKTCTMLLRYFTQVFLSEVILVSPECIPDDFKEELYHFMTEFLATADYRQIMKGEVDHWYVWSTFLPYIKLFYMPKRKGLNSNGQTNGASSDMTTEKLRMIGLRTILLALMNMLSRSNHREVLWKEQLQDFVTCVPSYVPETLRSQAKELVRIVASDRYQLQPPKLLNLVKAKLAQAHFGLETVLSRNVGELVNAILCNGSVSNNTLP